jgi:hypothetical protein
VILTRDVTFDRTSFYDPSNTKLCDILQETTEDLVERLEVPAIPQEASSRYRSIESEWFEPILTNHGKRANSNIAPSTTPIQLPSPETTPEALSSTPSNISLPVSPVTLHSSELSYDNTDEGVDLPSQPPTPLALEILATMPLALMRSILE